MNACFNLLLVMALLIAVSGTCAALPKDNLMNQVGQPIDITPSAYKFKAGSKPEANDPESWFAVMRYAGLPLNKKVDLGSPAVKRVLATLLWEEIRPIERLVLTWPKKAKMPTATDIQICTLDHQGTASSWWNNLLSVESNVKPEVSKDGRVLTYDLNKATCGLVIALRKGAAADFAVPLAQVFTADKWKSMEVEVEWGFDGKNSDYSGKIEAYDGRLSPVKPIENDETTSATPTRWSSKGQAKHKRGITFDLLYMGTSKWRKTQPYTSKRDDVARTIVTLWTKSGNCSFLASDLERGPIYVPEHGLFIRNTNLSRQGEIAPDFRTGQDLLDAKMDAIAGNSLLKGWGTDACPWFGGNPTDHLISVQGIEFPAKRLAMHPGPDQNVCVGWRSPVSGKVTVDVSVAHAQSGGDGIEWHIVLNNSARAIGLGQGITDGKAAQQSNSRDVSVEPGDLVSLVVGPKNNHFCDTTLIEFKITDSKGNRWDITNDLIDKIQQGNPQGVWEVYTEERSPDGRTNRDETPFSLFSNASSAKEFIKELSKRDLKTIRQQVRDHEEQTWEGAMAAFHKGPFPEIPEPPKDMANPMKVVVPSKELTAQWNLAKWHMVRHCAIHPETKRLWFNDFPYGILAAETYLVLRVLDQIGAHKEAEDGFHQWTSLPMDTDSAGHNEGALRDRPNGLFSDGHGCLTAAVGPDGWGGQMDGVHAFGPGAIGWALTEHYWMSGGKDWLKANAKRILANVEWMLRQRRVMMEAVPGGERLWCKGLQPALQVTPDSGGEWMQFYEAEAYYWSSISRLAETLAEVDKDAAKKLKAEAKAYERDLRKAVDRSIALSPVVPVRDGTYRSVIPFACYVRGLGTGAWGWKRDNSGSHVGPLYWETIQSAAPLVSPAGLLKASDPRVQGYLDVLEDRLLFENPRAEKVGWFDRGFHYQLGLERTANMHLAGDDAPSFLRTWLNGYAVDVLPDVGYTFNEHVYRGPEDKIFEEAAFLERFRDLLVCEEGNTLWLAKAAPRAWFAEGKAILVENAPTHFGEISYRIVAGNDAIQAEIRMPERGKCEVWLRFRHPEKRTIKEVIVNGKKWTDFDAKLEVVKLRNLTGVIGIKAIYK